MEPRFGHDFSRVRVYTDTSAARSAAALHARAYTVGSSVVFGPGEYQPQSAEGRRLLAHELTHVIQQSAAASVDAGLVHRQSAPSNAPAPPAAAPDTANETEEKEKKAVDAVKAKIGQPAAKVWYTSRNSTSGDPEIETFSIEGIIDRPGTSPPRQGFDSQAAAQTFAAMQGGSQGAVVLKEDVFFFAARLKAGHHKLASVKPTFFSQEPVSFVKLAVFGAASLVNPEWLSFTSNLVYRVEPLSGVLAVASVDGKLFPLNEDLEPDVDRAAKQNDPKMATAPEAEGMRALAGIGPERPKDDQPVKAADAVPIPADQQETFIMSYFRARAAEALHDNEVTVENLATTFKPTGTEKDSAKGVSSGAKKVIDASRDAGVNFRKLLDKEVDLAAEAFYLEQIRMGNDMSNIPQPKVKLAGEPGAIPLQECLDRLKKNLERVQKDKDDAMALSPLLATMVRRQNVPLARTDAEVGVAKKPEAIGPNPYDESLLAKPPTPEVDEQIRAEFEKKLDATRKALRAARAKMQGGDNDFVLGLEGLQSRVTQDFARMTGPNAAMKDVLKQMISNKHTRETVELVVGTVIEIGLLFVPGGQLLSAAFGMGMAAVQLDASAQRGVIADASLDPAHSLVDQAKAADDIALNGLMLATAAVFFGMAVRDALHGGAGVAKIAGEEAKEAKTQSNVAKNLTEAEEAEEAARTGKGLKKEGKTASGPEEPIPDSVDIPEAVPGDGTHQGFFTPEGFTICSPRPCPIVSTEIKTAAAKVRAEQHALPAPLAKQVETDLQAFEAEAASIDAQARELAKAREAAEAERKAWNAANPKAELPEKLELKKLELQTQGRGLSNARRSIKQRMAKLPASLPVRKAVREAMAGELSKLGLSDAAMERIFAKAPEGSHMKGQLLEELLELEVSKRPGFVTDLATMKDGEKMFIPGYKVRLQGRQFSDGVVVEKRGGKLVVTDIFEAKAGPFAAEGLGAGRGVSKIEDLTASEFTELQRESLDQLKQTKYRDKRLKEIWDESEPEVRKLMQEKLDTSDIGQVRRDIERLTPGHGPKPDYDEQTFTMVEIDGVPTQVVGSPKKTSITGVTATGTKVDQTTADALKDEGLKFKEKQLTISQTELDGLAKRMEEAAQKAEQK
jgi:hypothetical protein